MQPDPNIAALFRPFRLNTSLHLKNRIVQAPCTRSRCDLPGHEPTKGAVSYYAGRAAAGLQITEAVMISRDCQGYINTPGIWTDAQAARWRDVTDAVHAAGGLIFCQLWHTGRLSHSFFTGARPVAPSPVPTYGEVRQSRGIPLCHETPREFTLDEVRAIVALYRHCAANAKAAGFDGVEIHGANGYLPDQFLRQFTNRRTDDYGGSPGNRARFTIEIVEACADVFGRDRVGLRLSPAAYFGMMEHRAGDEAAYVHVIEHVNRASIAYLHTGIVDDLPYDYLGGTSTEFLRRHYRGTVIANGGYPPAKAAAAIAEGAFDLIAFGKLFIANADLVAKLKSGAPLVPYNRAAMLHLME